MHPSLTLEYNRRGILSSHRCPIFNLHIQKYSRLRSGSARHVKHTHDSVPSGRASPLRRTARHQRPKCTKCLPPSPLCRQKLSTAFVLCCVTTALPNEPISTEISTMTGTKSSIASWIWPTFLRLPDDCTMLLFRSSITCRDLQVRGRPFDFCIPSPFTQALRNMSRCSDCGATAGQSKRRT